MSRFRAVFLVVCGIVAAFALAFVLTPPRGARSMREFNPPRLANLEVRMWQAYYAKERLRLFGLLVTMLHEQYHYSWATATLEGFHLARAAATFGDLRGGTTWCFRTWRPRTRKRSRGRRPSSIPARWRARSSRGGWRGGCRVRTAPSRSADSSPTSTRCCTDVARARRSGSAVARAGGRAARRPDRPARLGSNWPAAAPVLQRAALGAIF